MRDVRPPRPPQTWNEEHSGRPHGPQIHPRRPRRGRIGRFFRGYLMLVGMLTTIAGLVLLLVKLFVEIEKWTGL